MKMQVRPGEVERQLPRCGSCNCRDRCWGGFLAWRRHQERLPESERDPRYRPRLMDQLEANR
jgi:hypothetical protein